MTREEICEEIEKMKEDWPKRQEYPKTTSGKSSSTSFILLMIELLIGVILFKLLV